jgi:hypothetical protein
LSALPARAQDSGGGLPAVVKDLAALTARVAKLEGQIQRADLTGNWHVVGFFSGLDALIPGTPTPQRQASIASAVFTGTARLNDNGTGTITTNIEGTTLIQGLWTLTPGSDSGTDNFTWSYSNGIVTTSMDMELAVGPGGRLLVGGLSDYDRSNNNSETVIVVLTRLSR